MFLYKSLSKNQDVSRNLLDFHYINPSSAARTHFQLRSHQHPTRRKWIATRPSVVNLRLHWQLATLILQWMQKGDAHKWESWSLYPGFFRNSCSFKKSQGTNHPNGSLSTRILLSTSASSICLGSGSCTKIAWTCHSEKCLARKLASFFKILWCSRDNQISKNQRKMEKLHSVAARKIEKEGLE